MTPHPLNPFFGGLLKLKIGIFDQFFKLFTLGGYWWVSQLKFCHKKVLYLQVETVFEPKNLFGPHSGLSGRLKRSISCQMWAFFTTLSSKCIKISTIMVLHPQIMAQNNP